MRRKGLLIIGLALLIAAAGVVYAHWQDSLNVSATVETGSIAMSFRAGTDDDGILTNDPSGLDGQVDVPPGTYDAWPGTSSDDPAGMYRYNSSTGFEGYVNPYGFPRYDKDVGICTATYDAATQTLTLAIGNAYPSYFCSMFFYAENAGTVPVKLQGGTSSGLPVKVGSEATAAPGLFYGGVPGWATTTGLPGVTYDGIHELTFDLAKGMWCGTQIDPNQAEDQMMVFWVHVEQGDDPATEGEYENATMGQQYTFSWTMDFVNWNEWDADACPCGTLPEDWGIGDAQRTTACPQP